MAKDVRIGIIGVGGISTGHIQGFRALKGVDVVALADVSSERINHMIKLINDKSWKPKSYKNHQTMLAKAELDAVVISTPHTLHYQQCLDALDANCHLFLEKPMVTTVAHARDVIKRAKKAKRALLVNYQRHYSPLYLLAKKLIDKGELGELTGTTGYLAQAYLPHCHTWRGDPELCGPAGQFNDSGSHLVAAMLWCSGLKPVEVFCYGTNGPARVNLSTAASILFNTGCLGTLSINGYVAEGFEEELVFWGTEGSLYIKDGKVSLARGSARPEPIEKMPEARNRYEEFVNAMRGKGKITSGGEIGLKVTALTEAAMTSIAERRPVPVDL